MPQLNVLPVEMSQPTDFKSESSSAAADGQRSNDSFSAMVDRHLDSGKSGKSSSQSDSSGKKLSKEEHNQTISDNKSLADNDKNIKETSSDSTNTHDEKVEAINQGNNSENSKETSTGDEKSIESDITSESEQEGSAEPSQQALDEEQLTQAELNQIEQSQHFLSLVNSANNILKTSDNTQVSEQNNANVKAETNTQLADLIAKLTGKTEDIVGDESVKQDQSSTASNEELALKISQTIKSEQSKQTDKVPSLAEEATKLASESDLTAVESDVDGITESNTANVAKNIEGKSPLTAQQVEQIKSALDKNAASEQSLNDEVELKDVDVELINPINAQEVKLSNQKSQLQENKENKQVVSTANVQGGDKSLTEAQALLAKESAQEQLTKSAETQAELQSTVQSSSTQSAAIQGKSSAQSKVESQQTSLNSTLESKVSPAEQQPTNEQINDTSANEQEFIQNAAVLNATDELSENSVKKPSVFSANLTPVQSAIGLADNASQILRANELESSQNIIEEMGSSIVNDNINQIKNNANTVNETISIFRKDFAEAVKDKVMVMISQKLQQFDIRLDPPELGNVHVRVNLQNEQAVVNFVVQNQQAKEAFEENLGKLKDMLSEQGVDVGDANVEQQAQQSDDEETGQGENGNHNSENNELESVDTVLSTDLFKSSSSSVDYYA